ncbi:MAG: OmpA family protein, partial [Bacteroidota bacterium]
EYRIECCKFAINAISKPVSFQPENLGESINSRYDEYFPSLTVDDQSIIFTRNRPDVEGSTRFHEDFYISRWSGNSWELARNAGGSLNTGGNEGVPCYSSDGKVLFFAACQRSDGKGSCDIYYSANRKDGWTRPLNLGGPVNTGMWESQPSFSSDGRTLYFIRGRITGTGIREQDIYVSKIGDDRKWSEPMKLAANINTPEEEEFVFIHPDNQTLYFSSDGHIGMGGLDIYVSRRNPDGSWGNPVNLGYPINTFGDERGLLVGPKGNVAYISSDRKGGYGGLDLYKFELHERARPIATGYVKGTVVDANTRAKLAASYEIIDLESGKSLVKSGTEEGIGTFLASLPSGKEYLLNVSREGYVFYSDNFSYTNPGSVDKPYQIEIKMEPISIGSKVVLKNIFFASGSFELKQSSFPELEKVLGFLKSNPKVKIELSGHTDNIGDKKSNLILSKNRAKAVYDHLVSKGVSPSRLSFEGYGDTMPVELNTNEEGRAVNRRTEFKITSVE